MEVDYGRKNEDSLLHMHANPDKGDARNELLPSYLHLCHHSHDREAEGETKSCELMHHLLNTSYRLRKSKNEMEEAINRMCSIGYIEKYQYDILINTVKGLSNRVKTANKWVFALYKEGHEGAGPST